MFVYTVEQSEDYGPSVILSIHKSHDIAVQKAIELKNKSLETWRGSNTEETTHQENPIFITRNGYESWEVSKHLIEE